MTMTIRSNIFSLLNISIAWYEHVNQRTNIFNTKCTCRSASRGVIKTLGKARDVRGWVWPPRRSVCVLITSIVIISRPFSRERWKLMGGDDFTFLRRLFLHIGAYVATFLQPSFALCYAPACIILRVCWCISYRFRRACLKYSQTFKLFNKAAVIALIDTRFFAIDSSYLHECSAPTSITATSIIRSVGSQDFNDDVSRNYQEVCDTSLAKLCGTSGHRGCSSSRIRAELLRRATLKLARAREESRALPQGLRAAILRAQRRWGARRAARGAGGWIEPERCSEVGYRDRWHDVYT